VMTCATIPRSTTTHPLSEQLVPVSKSGRPMTGEVRVTYYPHDMRSKTGQSVKVTINAAGFVPGTIHAAHIHSGDCTIQGPVAYMLPDLTANAGGMIDATTTVPVTGPPPHGGWYINIHQSNSGMILRAGQPTLNFRPLLCGGVGSVPLGSADR
jgi:hypothetical protein